MSTKENTTTTVDKPTQRGAGTPQKRQYQDWLNELEVPREDLKSEGGRIPDKARYGDWLRRNDPIAFNVGFNDYARGAQ